MKEKYQCLVAGLAELDMDMKKSPYSVDALVDELYTYLDAKDISLLQLLQIRIDLYNMGRLIDAESDHISYRPGGLLSKSELETLMQAKSIPEPDIFPATHMDFLIYCVAHYKSGQELVSGKVWEDQFLTLYFQYASQYRNNSFIQLWLGFEENLRNLQTAVLAQEYPVDLTNKLIGENEFAQALQTVKSKDFGLSGEYDYVENVLAAMGEENLLIQERMLDQVKWHKLEAFLTFHYFSVDVVLAYFVRFTIAARWLDLDQEDGQQHFTSLFQHLIESGQELEAGQ